MTLTVRLGARRLPGKQVFRLLLPVPCIFLTLLSIADDVSCLGKIGNAGIGNAGERSVAKIGQLLAEHGAYTVDQGYVVLDNALAAS